MSLVQAFIYKDFIVVGGEKKATLQGGIVVDNFNKVVKLNEVIIIGMTGTVEGNARLFSQFLNGDLSKKMDHPNLSYNEMIAITNKSYYDNQKFLNDHTIHSVVCGWNGKKLKGVAYFIETGKDKFTGPIDVTPQYDNEISIVNCGRNEHYWDAYKLLEKNNPRNILQIKNLFRDVIDIGMKYDKSINNNISFEKIRKIDVCGN